MFIEQQEILPGQDVQINLNIAKLPSRTTIDIPVYISRSVNPGPTLLLLAGMHGDEINGIEVLRRVVASGINKPIAGTVITIPIINIYGFLNFSRSLPDGKDINRSFPGNAKGSLASRVAYTLVNEILPLVDYGIDLHTGGEQRTNYPQIRCDFNNFEALKLANAFNAPFTINAALRPRSLRSFATKKEKPIIVYEGGESLRFDNLAIELAIDGIKRVMNHLGMANYRIGKGEESTKISRMLWVRSQASGLFHTNLQYGDKVTKQQVIGKITDCYGAFEKKIKAPHDGYVIGLNQIPVVNQGDALINIGVQ